MKLKTEKQQKLLQYIAEFIQENGMAPSVYEIAEKFGIKTSTVFAHLRACQNKGYLTRSGKARSIRIIDPEMKASAPPTAAELANLIGRLKRLNEYTLGSREILRQAELLLLQFINDPGVTAVFEAIRKKHEQEER